MNASWGRIIVHVYELERSPEIRDTFALCVPGDRNTRARLPFWRMIANAATILVITACGWMAIFAFARLIW